jgi:hypothetical protein
MNNPDIDEVKRLRDWNPLSYFPELRTFPRTMFLLGFIFLAVGVKGGVSPYNRILILALAIIAFSLAFHYFSNWRQDVWYYDAPAPVNWGALRAGTLTLTVALALLWWLWLVSGRPMYFR